MAGVVKGAETKLRRAEDRVQTHGAGWKDSMGRVGLVGRGVLYGVIALLALQLAFGSPTEEASSEGAIEWIAGQPFGQFLLVALTVSLFALAAWRFLDALVGDPVEGDEGSDRVRFAAKGVVYLALAVTALSTTISNWGGGTSSGGSSGGSGGSGQSEQKATAVVLDWPMGRWIVGAVGLAVIGYAVYVFKRHSVDSKFMERLSTTSDAVERAGRFGYAARSVVWALIGYFLVQAAITYDPEQAKGLSGALQEVADASWGPWLLGAMALGLLAFGAFCVAEARYRRAA